jgi:hypothetical protein
MHFHGQACGDLRALQPGNDTTVRQPASQFSQGLRGLSRLGRPPARTSGALLLCLFWVLA